MQILFARLFSRITPTEPTFGLVANEWLDSVSTCVKLSTYSVYSAIEAKYIPLGLQAKPITSVTSGDIHRMLCEAEHPSGREPLSASRMHTICTVINSILDFARDRGLDSACRPVHHSAGASRPSVDPLTGEEDRCLDPRTYQNRFYVMLRRAGVRKVSFHTLRHTFATYCVDMGCDPKTLCEILGHSDVSITLNIYVHPSVPAKRELIEQLSSRSDITRNKV